MQVDDKEKNRRESPSRRCHAPGNGSADERLPPNAQIVECYLGHLNRAAVIRRRHNLCPRLWLPSKVPPSLNHALASNIPTPSALLEFGALAPGAPGRESIDDVGTLAENQEMVGKRKRFQLHPSTRGGHFSDR